MTLQKNFIKSTPQLSTMNFSQIINSQNGKVKTFRKGAKIYSAGETIRNLMLVESGDIKILDDQNSSKVPYIKWFNYKGSLMDLTGFLGRKKYVDTAIAMTDVNLRIWSKEGVMQSSKYNDAFNGLVFQQIIDNNLKLERRLNARFTLSSRQRVIDLLIELSKEKGERVGYEILVRSSLTHQEMANYANTARQTVTTVLNELKNKNLLVFDRRRMLFRDLDKVKALLELAE